MFPFRLPKGTDAVNIYIDNWRRHGGALWRYLPWHPFGKKLLDFQHYIATCQQFYRIDPQSEGMRWARNNAARLCIQPDADQYFVYADPQKCVTGNYREGNLRVLKRTKYHLYTWRDLLKHVNVRLHEVNLIRFDLDEAVLYAKGRHVVTIEFSEERAAHIVEILQFLTGLQYNLDQFPNGYHAIAQKDGWRWRLERYHTL